MRQELEVPLGWYPNKEQVPRIARPAIQVTTDASRVAHLLPSSMLSMASITLR